MKNARTPRAGFIKGTPFQCGPMMKKSSDCIAAAAYGGNRGRLWEFNKRVKLFHGADGWFADGVHGQVWEYGKGMLGFTIASNRMVVKALSEGFVPTQLGHDEANFSCPWTPEMEGRLIALLKLRIRKGPPACPFIPGDGTRLV